jgi:hypothetical protein
MARATEKKISNTNRIDEERGSEEESNTERKETRIWRRLGLGIGQELGRKAMGSVGGNGKERDKTKERRASLFLD